MYRTALPLAIVAADAAPGLGLFYPGCSTAGSCVLPLFHEQYSSRWRLVFPLEGCIRAHRAAVVVLLALTPRRSCVEPRIASVSFLCVCLWRGAGGPALRFHSPNHRVSSRSSKPRADSAVTDLLLPAWIITASAVAIGPGDPTTRHGVTDTSSPVSGGSEPWVLTAVAPSSALRC